MTSQYQPSTPLSRVLYFPYVGAATICMGIYLHVTRLFLEPVDLLKIYTPGFDLAIFIPMVFTAICMLAFRSRVNLELRWRRAIYWVTAVYFWLSVPIHLKAQIAQSNDFVFAFPSWYSVVLLPWLGVQLYLFMTMNVKPALQVVDGIRAHA